MLIITLVSESFGESIDSNSNAVTAVIDDNVRKEALRKYFVDLLTREYHAASALIAANKPAVSQVREEHVHSSDTNDAIPPRNKKLKLLDDMELLSNSHTTDTDGGHAHALLLEITAYLGPDVLSEEEKLSPLKFWKRNEHVYPHLSLLARVFLTPCASSVAVESLFSITGLTKNTRRSSLTPFRMNKLTFIHDNYPAFFPIGK